MAHYTCSYCGTEQSFRHQREYLPDDDLGVRVFKVFTRCKTCRKRTDLRTSTELAEKMRKAMLRLQQEQHKPSAQRSYQRAKAILNEEIQQKDLTPYDD